jgi:hypothetical protein
MNFEKLPSYKITSLKQSNFISCMTQLLKMERGLIDVNIEDLDKKVPIFTLPLS